MKLLADLVAVRPFERPQLGKVIVPDWSRSLQGKVISVGNDVDELKIGDTVYFKATSGMESVFDGAPLRIMREEDVLCVL